MRKILYISSILIFLGACQKEVRVGTHKESDFFDLTSFVHQEKERLQQGSCSIYKEASIELEDDAVNVDIENFNWDKEFNVLSDFNIRKSAWYDYFSIDTIQEEIEGMGEVMSIHYVTNSSKIPIKTLKISFLPDNLQQPVLIEGERKVKTWIFHTEQKVYYTGSALRIEGYQKVLWFQEKNFNITTIYNCHNESN